MDDPMRVFQTPENSVARDLPLSLAPLYFLLCLITPTPFSGG
jgi:hypothetical protein